MIGISSALLERDRPCRSSSAFEPIFFVERVGRKNKPSEMREKQTFYRFHLEHGRRSMTPVADLGTKGDPRSRRGTVE